MTQEIMKKPRPELRFKGFTDDWAQRQLKDVADIHSGRDYKHLPEGDIPVYGTGGYMCSVNAALSYDKDAVGIGRKGTIDKPVLLKAPFWTVDTLFFVTNHDSVDLYFLLQVFKGVNWLLKNEASGIPSLSKTIIGNTKVRVPNSPEQRRIGEFFKTLDDLIVAAERKVELLKRKKQAYLQRIFNQDLRFKGFTDDWAQRQLKELLSYRRPDKFIVGDDRIMQSTTQDDIPVLTANKAFILGYTKDKTHVMSEVPSIIFDDFTMDSKYVNFPYSVRSSAIKILQNKPNVDIYFCNLILNAIHFPDLGHARHYISYVQNQECNIPSFAEQKRIGDFFRTLDDLIVAAEHKVTLLKQKKQSYMQRMFI